LRIELDLSVSGPSCFVGHPGACETTQESGFLAASPVRSPASGSGTIEAMPVVEADAQVVEGPDLATVAELGSEFVMYASDSPHWDSEFPRAPDLWASPGIWTRARAAIGWQRTALLRD
jgi:hypothetical protein